MRTPARSATGITSLRKPSKRSHICRRVCAGSRDGGSRGSHPNSAEVMMIQYFTISPIGGTATLSSARRNAMESESASHGFSRGTKRPTAPKIFRPAADRGTGFPCPGHEITNQLSDTLTTTSTGKPPPTPPTCAKLDTNARIRHSLLRPAERQNAQIRNLLRRPAVYRCPRA